MNDYFETVHKRKVSWPMSDKLTPEQYQINQWIDKLDSLAVEYEARWGAGVLPRLVRPDTALKWERQLRKVNEAIEKNDLHLMVELCEGMARGWDALEKQAMALGHKPHGAPVAWTVRMPNGQELAICATRNDAAMIAANCAKERNMVVWTIQEVANLIANVNKIYDPDVKKQVMTEKRLPEFDFTKGDIDKLHEF